jgi:hypothetical protein
VVGILLFEPEGASIWAGGSPMFPRGQALHRLPCASPRRVGPGWVGSGS